MIPAGIASTVGTVVTKCMHQDTLCSVACVCYGLCFRQLYRIDALIYGLEVMSLT